MSSTNLVLQDSTTLSDFRRAIEAEPHVITLTASEQADVLSIIRGLPPLSLASVDDAFLTTLEISSRSLPRRLSQALIAFRRAPPACGHLLLKNLPLDPSLPATPFDGRPSKAKCTSISEYSLLLTMLHLGEPISYLDEKEGSLVQNICPVRGQEHLQENTGSSLLEFHTEDGFHPNKPDHLALYCLRSDHEQKALTCSASIREVVRQLPASLLDALRRPAFRIKLSSSFQHGLPSTTRYSSPIPVLTGSIFEPDMCVDFFLMEGLDRSAKVALKLLQEQLTMAMRTYLLLPGDLLIIDNRIAAHGRTSFTPRYDGQDRWLQRMFTIRDSRSAASSRIPGSRVHGPLDLQQHVYSEI